MKKQKRTLNEKQASETQDTSHNHVKNPKNVDIYILCHLFKFAVLRHVYTFISL